MTESEAVEKLEAHIECESKRSSIEGCNDGCIDCELAYLQGTSKEHIESVKLAIQALEKQIPMKPRNERRPVPLPRTSVRFVDWYKCGKCNSDLNRQFVCCPYCQSVIDWSDGNDA